MEVAPDARACLEAWIPKPVSVINMRMASILSFCLHASSTSGEIWCFKDGANQRCIGRGGLMPMVGIDLVG